MKYGRVVVLVKCFIILFVALFLCSECANLNLFWCNLKILFYWNLSFAMHF